MIPYLFIIMSKLKTALMTVVFTFISYSVLAESRPRIGLVLSGGGARGAAHVGVLKVLEELRIPVDVISGTSMGSIVGGLYSSGMKAHDIERALSDMDWGLALTDVPSREYQSYNRRRQQDLFTTNFNLGFKDGHIQLPPGAIFGQNIDLALQRLTNDVVHIADFDHLMIPFRAVATDLAKGEVVVLGSGSLALAMRASMSVPSLFSPVKLDGRLLVDGGVTNNLPVDIAREMGADILIVIDISTPLKDEDDLDSLFAVTGQLTRLLTGLNTKASRDSLSVGDVLLVPELGDITSSQFDRSEEAIVIGEAEARKNMAALAPLSVSPSEYETYLAALTRIPSPVQTILSVTVDNQSHINDVVITDLVATKSQQVLDLDVIESDIDKIYGLGLFEKVAYRLSTQATGIEVDFHAIPKSWGPDYLHFGFSMDSDHNGDSNANITLGYTRSELNSFGAEWTSLFHAGSDPILYSYFHQPISWDLSYFVEPYVSAGQINSGLFNADGDQFAVVRVKQTEFGLVLGKAFSANTVATLDFAQINGDVDVLIGEDLFPTTKYDDGGITASVTFDSLNSVNFPTKGHSINASYYRAFDALGASDEFEQWRFNVSTVNSFGAHTVVLTTRTGGTVNGDAAIPKFFSVGGLFNLSGFRENEKSGQFLGLASATYYRRFNRIEIFPAYIGASVEYGGVWQAKDEIAHKSADLGGSAFIGVDSPVGPVLLGIGSNDDGSTIGYFKVGRLF
jgi:NTE family protein